jgi:hypothetical protein
MIFQPIESHITQSHHQGLHPGRRLYILLMAALLTIPLVDAQITATGLCDTGLTPKTLQACGLSHEHSGYSGEPGERATA